MNIYKFLSVIYYIGMALVFLGILMHMSGLTYGAWCFAGGAVIMVAIRLYNRMVGKPENQRVYTIMLYSAVLLLLAAWAMLAHRGYWIIFIILTAILDTYASYRRIKK
ncbi:hypothetical protein KDU71_10210 [Carboxylicivirga sediminis]|uniref:Uncharacterized protein n=1 Tax=Carboxylicivirga sediminis TaxID=2006564 RepID=A0A941F585_9BACT|nr:hypothetical protein [Carboxylicivirga sediminis]MBR8535930.1 hypothetical protein [Carboxylicivirga sediminis]